MPASVISTKLHIPPPRSKVVSRPRLIERLNGEPGRKLTLVSAPAGFGKTTLVIEWLAALTHPIAWVSLDEGDKELSRFLTYLVSALQTVEADTGAAVLSVLQSHQPPSTETLLTDLLNDIDSISRDFILVLDDYHELDSKPVDEALLFLVENLPPQMHLVIASREDPPLPLARLRARGQLTELRTADLRFTSAEAAEFLNQVMGLSLSAEDVSALETRTEGWIAGLQLAALSMQGNQDIAGFIQSFTGAHHFVLDYLLEEVLQRQPQNIQQFLLRTSILNRLSGSLCDAVLGNEKPVSQKALEYLEHSNLFIVALDGERRWYRYHHLFGDLLRQRLGQGLTFDEAAQLHIRASKWYEENGELSDAFRHAMSAKDFNRAAEVAERAWLGMDENFQSGMWLGWVNQLSGSVRRLRPVLCVQIAWAYMDAGKADESESYLLEAEQCLRESPGEMIVVDESQFKTLPARIAIARAYNSQTKGEVSATVKFAEAALRLTPEENQFMRAQTTAILAGAHWANGELDVAFRAMSTWRDQVRMAGNFVFAIMTAHGLADILLAQGRLRDVVTMYEESLQFAAGFGKEGERFTAHHHLGLAMLFHEMGADTAAEEHLQKSLELGVGFTIVDWAYRRDLAQARLKESAGDFDAALKLFDDAKKSYVRTPIPDAQPIEAFKARVYLKHGQAAKARAWASRFSVDDELSYLREFEHITLARVLIAEYQNHKTKHLQPVLDFLDRLLIMAQAGNRIGSTIEILILQALAHQAQGNPSKALVSLQHALTLAEPEGYLRLFVNEGEPARLLIADLRLTIERTAHPLFGYIEKILAEFPQSTLPPNPKSKIVNQKYELIDPLSERELEVLRLVAQGFSNTVISEKLFLSLSTVKGHNLRIFNKLQAKSRTEAVARARELGLL